VFDVESHVTQMVLSMFNEHSEQRWLCGYPVSVVGAKTCQTCLYVFITVGS